MMSKTPNFKWCRTMLEWKRNLINQLKVQNNRIKVMNYHSDVTRKKWTCLSDQMLIPKVEVVKQNMISDQLIQRATLTLKIVQVLALAVKLIINKIKQRCKFLMKVN